MRFQILHETHYTYSQPVQAVALEARLQPCNDEYQSRQRYRLLISPKASIEEYTTFSDVLVQYWTLLKADEIHVVSDSVVDTRERPLTAIHVPPFDVDPIAFYPYLHETALTKITPAIEEFAAPFARIAAEDWYALTMTVREAIHKTIDFEAGHTTTDTTADEALRLGSGVCQDFTHLMIATLRHLGLPARYTSGYLNPNVGQTSYARQEMGGGIMMQEQGTAAVLEEIAKSPLRGTGASHAWCEVYFGPEHGWRGFDAANSLLADQNFIRIGAGRDFRDISPLKGVHKGAVQEKLKVTVSVKKLL